MALLASLALAMLPSATAQSTDYASSCTGDQYMSKNGLNFYTDCPAEAGTSSATYFDSDSRAGVDDCMDWCAIIRQCYAITYSNGDCYVYGEDLYPKNATGSKAIADPSQLRTPDEGVPTCSNSSSFQTPDGEEFQITCNRDYGGDDVDYCPWEGYPSKCARHTDTFEECMQYCSEAHPLCVGVAYNPDMLDGFGNCYLKHQPADNFYTTPNGAVVHSASVSRFNHVNTACPTETQPYEVRGSNYTVSCGKDRTDTQNTTSVHSDSLDGCLTECSSGLYEGCLGVLFDMSMENGYRNCYLLNDTGSDLGGRANSTFARLTVDRVSQGSSDGGGGGSKAWIAGPVVGIAVIIAAVVGGVLWWRRRRQPDAMSGEPTVRHEKSGESTVRHEKSGKPTVRHEKSGEPTVRHEMRDPNSERLWPPEMNA